MSEKKLPICRVFTLSALAFLSGVALSSLLKINFDRSFPCLIIFLFLLLFVYLYNRLFRNNLLSSISILLFFFYVGLGYYSYFNTNLEKSSSVLGSTLSISGKIVGKPERTYNSQKVLLSTDISGEEQLLSVSLPSFPTCYYGDTLTFTGQVDQIDYADAGRTLKAKKVTGQVLRPTEVTCTPSALNIKQIFIKNLYLFGERTEYVFGQLLPEPEASFAAGLILGSKRNIPEDVSNALSITGLTHVIALSGYNITIIIFVLSGLLVEYLGRKKVLAVGLIFIVMFVVMTGGSSSVVRAAIFSLCVLLGGIWGRRGDMTNLMLLAAVLMILLNPFVLIFDVGFQLSFLAFSGLIYLSPVVETLLNKFLTPHLPSFVSGTLIETLAAQIAVLPLILFYFGRFSIIAPLSNLVILWLIPLAMLLSFLVGILGLIALPLGKLVVIVAWPILTLIINLILIMAKIPLASISLKKSNPIYLSIYLLILTITLFVVRRNKKVIVV